MLTDRYARGEIERLRNILVYIWHRAEPGSEIESAARNAVFGCRCLYDPCKCPTPKKEPNARRPY